MLLSDVTSAAFSDWLTNAEILELELKFHRQNIHKKYNTKADKEHSVLIYL